MTDIIEDEIILDEDIPETPEEEETPKFTILQVWLELLGYAEQAIGEPVPMHEAVALLTKHPILKMGDLSDLRSAYYRVLMEAEAIVQFEVDENPGCLTKVDTDAEANRMIYLNILLKWQQMFAEMRRSWNSDDEDASVLLAAYIDAAETITGPDGVAKYLGNIGFEFSESDAEELAELANEEVQ